MVKINDETKSTGSHWAQLDGEKPIVCIDFDHTVSKKCLACDDGLLGDGIQKGAREAILELSKRFRIWIYTGIIKQFKSRNIEEFLTREGIPYDKIVRTKPPACFIIDDRAIYHTSWKNTMSEIKRRGG